VAPRARAGADAPPPRALQLATGTQAPARVVAEEGRTSEEGMPEKDAFATPTGAEEPQARRAVARCARACVRCALLRGGAGARGGGVARRRRPRICFRVFFTPARAGQFSRCRAAR
jgi:hypothetical protein